MTTNLINQEIEELRIAIAEEMGWRKSLDFNKEGSNYHKCLRRFNCTRHVDLLPLYTTSIDAIREAAMERFKSGEDAFAFHGEIIRLECDGDKYCWQLTALDWAIAFARTAKIWRYKV